MTAATTLLLVALLISASYAAGRVHAGGGYRFGYRFGYRQGYLDGDRAGRYQRRWEAQIAGTHAAGWTGVAP